MFCWSTGSCFRKQADVVFLSCDILVVVVLVVAYGVGRDVSLESLVV